MQGNDKYERFLFRRPLIKFALIFVYCRANSASHKTHELCCFAREKSMPFVPNAQTLIKCLHRINAIKLTKNRFNGKSP